MVTTRRQSKQLDQPPALPPVAPPKRKRSNDATCVPSAAQPPNQPSTKRRKRVKSTAKVETLTEPSEPTLAAPLATKRSRPRKEEKSDTSLARKPQENKARLIAQSKAKAERPNGAQQSVHVDLTNDDDSSDDDAPRRAQPVGSQDTDGDDDDTDSRYALGSRRKGAIRKGTKSKPRQTAELKFEEDGLEVVDKSKVAAANRKNGLSFSDKKPGSASWTPIDSTTRTGTDRGQQVNEKRMNLAKSKKTLPPTGVPCKHIMYTIAEAIAALSLYRNGTMSHPAEIDPVSRRPYEPLQTGESLSYPVKGTYNLGALGRYGIDTLPPSPFSLTVPLSEHSYIQTDYKASTAEPSRAGLGFSSTLPNRPRGPLVRRPNNYCFTFGKYRGRRMDSVPVEYLRSIFRSDDYHNDAKLQQAFADLYPKGLYESDAESYTFEKGGFKGKRLDEVPKSYLWGLLRKKKEGGEAGGKKGRSRLERALEVWEQGQLDLTKD